LFKNLGIPQLISGDSSLCNQDITRFVVRRFLTSFGMTQSFYEGGGERGNSLLRISPLSSLILQRIRVIPSASEEPPSAAKVLQIMH
jgi:hypothetical protein